MQNSRDLIHFFNALSVNSRPNDCISGDERRVKHCILRRATAAAGKHPALRGSGTVRQAAMEAAVFPEQWPRVR